MKKIIFYFAPIFKAFCCYLKLGRSIGNKEIISLFGCRSTSTVSRLKKIAKDAMADHGIPSYGAYKVNTDIAFRTWGIDIIDMESRSKKLKELSL